MTQSCIGRNVDITILPMAGKGSRMFPVSRIIPKQMLFLGNKPIVEYVLRELREAGIKKCIAVLPNDNRKEIIINYLDNRHLDISLEYVIQKSPRGVADAIYACRDLTEEKPFCVALPDCIISTRDSYSSIPLMNLLDVFAKYECDIAVLGRLSKCREKKGILSYENDLNRNLIYLSATPGKYAAMPSSRWILSNKVFEYIERTLNSKIEVDLPTVVSSMIAAKESVLLLKHRCVAHDLGTWTDYILFQEQFK